MSRSTNGTHTPAPAAAPDAPMDPPGHAPSPDPATPSDTPPLPPPSPAAPLLPPAAPLLPPASPARPLASPHPLTTPRLPPSSRLQPPLAPPSAADPPAAASPLALRQPPAAAPKRSGGTWWGGPQRAARPLDRLSGLSQALVGDALLRHVAGCRVLDLGVGSPEIAQWVRNTSASLETVDVRMAATDAGEIRLPHDSERYDVVYSVRTLAHLGHDEASSELAVRSLLAEATRVLVPGGLLLVEINNPRSLRGLAYGIRRPITIVGEGSVVLAERQSVTRYDTLSRLVRLAPRTLELTRVYGIRVLVPISRFLQIPLLGRLLAAGEWWARDSFLRGFGAHLLVALRKHDDPIHKPGPDPRPAAPDPPPALKPSDPG